MTVLILDIAISVAIFITAVTILLLFRTPFFKHMQLRLFPAVSQDEARRLMSSPSFAQMTVGNTFAERQLKLVGTMSRASLEGDALVIRIQGFEPKVISLDHPRPVSKLFGLTSAEQIPLHAFEVHRHCVVLYNETGDDRLLKLFWTVYNEFVRSFNRSYLEPYSWHDHATVARMCNLHAALVILVKHNALSAHQFREMANLLILHGDFLAGDKVYDPVTNHGLIVDAWLLGSATHLSELPHGERWIQTAVSRSLGRIDHYISDDGVPLEPATTYWFLILKLFRQIEGLCVWSGLDVEERVAAKLNRCEEFLREISINGLYQRIGDSSGGHDIGFAESHRVEKDGYYLSVYDSGIIYLSALKNGQIVSQLLFNVQDPKPYVHRHEDALALNLYHKGVFWFNSPGSYSAEKTAQARRIKSYENQSIAYNGRYGYSHTCVIKDVQVSNPHTQIVAQVVDGDRPLVTRTVQFDLENEEVMIEDSASAGTDVVSQFLLRCDTVVENDSDSITTLTNGSATLEVSTSSQPVSRPAKISYARNEALDTTMLAFTDSANSIRFRLDNGIKTLSVLLDGHRYPYKKRRSYRKSVLANAATRLHKKRLKQIGALLVGQVLLVLIWLIAFA